MSLDRKDNDRGYSPENCRWATRSEQDNNKANSLRYTYNGESLSIAELAKFTKLNRKVVKGRLLRRWPVQEALDLPAVPGAKPSHYLDSPAVFKLYT